MGVKALDPPNSSLAQAIARVEAIKDFYSTSYPGLYVSEGRAIEKAIEELKDIARLTTFPDMKVSWKTYIDNAGYQKSLGCFRYHGKLVAITGAQKGKLLDASGNSYPLYLDSGIRPMCLSDVRN